MFVTFSSASKLPMFWLVTERSVRLTHNRGVIPNCRKKGDDDDHVSLLSSNTLSPQFSGNIGKVVWILVIHSNSTPMHGCGRNNAGVLCCCSTQVLIKWNTREVTIHTYLRAPIHGCVHASVALKSATYPPRLLRWRARCRLQGWWIVDGWRMSWLAFRNFRNSRPCIKTLRQPS